MRLIQSARTAIVSISRHRGPSCIAVATLTFMLSALTMFILVADGMNRAAGELESKANLIADLSNSTTQHAGRVLAHSVATRFPTSHVSYVSRSQALVEFRHTFSGNAAMLSALQGNPLPASLQVRTHDPASLNRMAGLLRATRGVSHLIFNPDLTHKLVEMTGFIRIAGIGLVVGLALLALFIVVNTTHLTVEARRNEIEVMKLIGATHSFVRNPLIVEGVLLGLVGALLAAVAGIGIYLPTLKTLLAGNGSSALAILPINTTPAFLGLVVAVVLAVGAGIGATGSYISVRRFANF